MRRILIHLCLFAAVVFLLSPPVLAQDAQKQATTDGIHPGNAAKVEELQRIIEEQQRQLDAQQEQLEAQKKKLQELRQQVQRKCLICGEIVDQVILENRQLM